MIRRGTRHRSRGGLRAALGLVLTALTALSALARAATATGADAPAWVPPARARVVPFAVDAPPRDAPVEVDPIAPIRLAPGSVLLVPIDPGDRVRVEGHVYAIGLGSGVRETPDVITWLPLPAPSAESGAAEAREVDVPMWTVARFLVIRTDKPAEVAVRTASLTRTAMPWHRLDEDVARWLRDPSAPPPETDIPEAAAGLRHLIAGASALSAAPRDAVADWLTVRWLEGSFTERPLIEPFFVRQTVKLTGGRDAAGLAGLAPDPDTSPFRVVLSSRGARAANMARIVIDAPDADVARVLVQARGLGVARARVYVNDLLVREIAWDVALRTADADRWTATSSLRVPLPEGARRVVVEAIQGEIAVTASAFRKRIDVLDALPRLRDRPHRLDALAALPSSPAATNLLRLAAAADRTGAARDVEAALLAAKKDDVPASVRAFVLAESVRWANTPDEALHAAERAFDLAVALPIGASGPVLRATLERLAAVYVDPLPPPRPWERPLREAAHEDDRAALDALRGMLSPPFDGRRPEFAPSAERFAWRHGETRDAATRARQTWVREAPWNTLDPPPGVAVWNEIGVPVDTYGETRCRVVGPRGLRWTVLGEGRTEIDVLRPPALASHSRILILPGQTEPLPETNLVVDGISATAHTGAGLGTTLAVMPGVHVFERPPGAAPLYARIQRDGAAPCESLRELTRWIRLKGSARFRIPDAGRATIARIVVFTAGAAPRKPRVLRLTVGDRIFEAWVQGGATGAIELPVPAEVSDIDVETTEETLLRVSARMHDAAAPPPRITTAGVAVSPEARSLLLARVRDATRELDGGPSSTREASHQKRAVALDSLGFPALAALDRGEDSALDALEDPAAPPTQALALPQGSPSVVPLGLVPKIPPLPLPTNLEPLTAARRAESTGDAAAALAALTKSDAGASTGADGLLYAVLAERAGAGFLAADVFERIGLVHRSGPALARAAALSADRSADDQDRPRALRSFVLAQLAADFGDPAAHAFARLAPAIGWLAVQRADSVAGTGLVDVRGGREPLPLGAEVRRALLDAREDALLLAEGQHVELRLKQSKPTSVGISTRCLALEPDPLCQLGVEVDGIPTPCGPADPASSRTVCTVSVPRGSHRLEIRGPQGRAVLGAVELSGAGGFAMEARVVSEWFELDAERPLELAFIAPTVVRLEARGPAGEPRTLLWSVTPNQTAPNVLSRGELVLDPAADPAAHLVGGDPKTLLPLGRELEKRIGVLDEGAHALRVTSPGGRSLVRVQLAVPIGLPKPRRLPAVRRLPDPPVIAPDTVVRASPDVVFDRDPGAVTLSVYGLYKNLDVDDEDSLTGKSFFELGLRARREIETVSGFASVAGFVRARAGAPSFGAAGWLDIAPHGFIPGVFLRGRVVAQPTTTGGFGFGLRALVGPLWSIPFGDSFSLVPWAAFALLRTDDLLARQDDADREIWTRYSSTRPYYGEIGLRSVFRLAIDGFASVGALARTTPDFAGIDRLDLQTLLQLLPGRGLAPWIALGAFTSYRPAGFDRKETFVRAGIDGRLTFWSWLSRGHRLSAGGEARLLLDVPRENSPFRLSGGIFAEYDFSGGRGLRDLPPRDAPFRARLEEGSGRVDRRKTSSDPTWATPP